MSYQNFKPDFWSKYIQGELGKLCVLHEDCDYTFEGEIKYGERIKNAPSRRTIVIKFDAPSSSCWNKLSR